ncbi:AbrB/MazE/SpoVT family DNA-binding domain-containing protein [Inmirania thermothiophila]|uniref:AbrB family looped-hinge helix DNA binding protein n=1 Tax=Inmirania thermothiophila TaxID=1750597 RepID=A0A3N1XZN2_9GAMM|nr:AbrB/MazE/SpoVT family DNA-binding domain-containing protein [Inmirania thermothiophila]ROR32055.1 AbrB family looped-hinge helix DNA binding protein [Inmirania thermothiophila]
MATASHEVRIGKQGRVVIPAELRAALKSKPRDRLIARVEGDRLVLETREALIERMQARFRHIPPEVSLVDELISERRQDARREEEALRRS